MAILSEIKSHPDVVDYFKKFPFYNKHIEKPKIKRLKKRWSINWTSFLWAIEHNKNKSNV